VELSDQIIPPNYNGDPGNNPPWVGFLKVNPTITLTFGATVNIKTVRLYLQGDGAGWLYLPSSVVISGSVFNIEDTGRNGWYEFTGSWTTSSLTVKLNQNIRSVGRTDDIWIFIGEIMIVEAQQGI